MLEKYLGQGLGLEITAPDGTKETIILKPLTVEYLPKFMKLISKFSDKKPDENFLKDIDDESARIISDLIFATLKLSLPNETDEVLKQFGLKYAVELLMKVFEINQLAEVKDPKLIEKIEQMKRNANPAINPTGTKTPI